LNRPAKILFTISISEIIDLAEEMVGLKERILPYGEREAKEVNQKR
jgi:hypothetical protein